MRRFAVGRRLAHTARSIVFAEYGVPREVLGVARHEIPDATGKQIVVRLLGTPVNPADVNQIEGVYPSKPKFSKALGTAHDVAVAGNEGAFEVVEVGPEEETFTVGDWVVPKLAAFGTWTSHRVTEAKELIKLPREAGLDALILSTISVNPSTAYRLLSDFANLEPGNWIIQNGGNSGVGRMVIQLAKVWGFKTISVVRDRRDIDSLTQELDDLGAHHVITEEQIADKSIKHIIRDWTGGQDVKLALNCVGGRSASNIARQLGPGGVLVTYGGMSKQPVSLATSMYIFSDLAARGFWLTRWNQHYPEDRVKMLNSLTGMFSEGELRVTAVTPQPLSLGSTDEEFLNAFVNAIEGSGKQVVLAEK